MSFRAWLAAVMLVLCNLVTLLGCESAAPVSVPATQKPTPSRPIAVQESMQEASLVSLPAFGVNAPQVEMASALSLPVPPVNVASQPASVVPNVKQKTDSNYEVHWIRPTDRAETDSIEVIDGGWLQGVRLVISSSRGVGSAEVRPITWVWPRLVQLQFQYTQDRPFSELEGLHVRVSPWANETSNKTPDLPPDDFVVWHRDGTLRVQLPAGWLQNRDTLLLSWVDRYRH